MCVVALALHQHPDWPIILIGNRDELHARAAAPLHMWDDGSGIVAGRDLVGGGTWLGVQPQRGALVVVTNVRSGAPPDPAKSSRGALVRDVLTGAGAFAGPDAGDLDSFNAFSLMSVAAGDAQIMTNRPRATIRPLNAGLYALANENIESPCLRADRLAAAVKHWLAIANAEPAALLDTLAAEGAPALFLRNPVYGTRCSTLVTVNQHGHGQIVERRYDKGGNPIGETALAFHFG
jgi:uncharacterized protein with NRDE domain